MRQNLFPVWLGRVACLLVAAAFVGSGEARWRADAPRERGIPGHPGPGVETAGGTEPFNDACDSAAAIADGVTPFSTVDATTDGVAHAGCGPGTGQTVADVWFDYTATCTGFLTVSTCGTADYDTDLVIYDAGGRDCAALACPPATADVLACNDDFPGCAGLTSELEGTVIAGNCYRIRVGGFDALEDQGTGTVALQCLPPDCGDAVTDFGEDCDDGGETATCDDDCSVVACGDGNHNGTAGEACDSAGDSVTCDGDCTLAVCGDSYLNAAANEQCDDGNTALGDGCDDQCRAELPGSCDTVEACCDLDQNTILDDVCAWCECTGAPGGNCTLIQRTVPGDIGGPFGMCPPDTFCNIHDRNHALACFSDQSPCSAINIDAGGPFGDCVPDGFCNIFDANHALDCFDGTSTCACGPAPDQPPAPVVGHSALSVRADRKSIRPGQRVAARVFLDTIPHILQGYQVDLDVSGGTRGSLQLVDITIDARRDFVFNGAPDRFEAFNVHRGEMLSGVDGGGVAPAGAYLATYTYRATADAAGDFVIDIAHDAVNGDQTFLLAGSVEQIEVSNTVPARLHIRAAGRTAARRGRP